MCWRVYESAVALLATAFLVVAIVFAAVVTRENWPAIGVHVLPVWLIPTWAAGAWVVVCFLDVETITDDER